jgi:predicted RNA-binding protein associated with RNAse of E/G family
VGLVDAIKSAFSFLSSRTQSEERIAQYVIREHHRGRPVHDILEDHYVTNRLTPEQIKRLLDRPDLLHALGEGLVTETKSTL